uniref:Uncharacterized protein n=1 Tax=Opuntia streptacantha TaxID=393608 RepID=A0A7C9CS84_OPUST
MDPAEVDYKTSLMRSFRQVEDELEQYGGARHELREQRGVQMAGVNAIDDLDHAPAPPAILAPFYREVQNLNWRITRLDLRIRENEAIRRDILQGMLSEDVLVVENEEDVEALFALRQIHGWHGGGFIRAGAPVAELTQLMHDLGIPVIP